MLAHWLAQSAVMLGTAHFLLRFADLFLFLCRQVQHFAAGFRTAGFHLSPACIALNEKQVAGIVGTIHMCICRGAALMALRDDLRRDALA